MCAAARRIILTALLIAAAPEGPAAAIYGDDIIRAAASPTVRMAEGQRFLAIRQQWNRDTDEGLPRALDQDGAPDARIAYSGAAVTVPWSKAAEGEG